MTKGTTLMGRALKWPRARSRLGSGSGILSCCLIGFVYIWLFLDWLSWFLRSCLFDFLDADSVNFSVPASEFISRTHSALFSAVGSVDWTLVSADTVLFAGDFSTWISSWTSVETGVFWACSAVVEVWIDIEKRGSSSVFTYTSSFKLGPEVSSPPNSLSIPTYAWDVKLMWPRGGDGKLV